MNRAKARKAIWPSPAVIILLLPLAALLLSCGPHQKSRQTKQPLPPKESAAAALAKLPWPSAPRYTLAGNNTQIRPKLLFSPNGKILGAEGAHVALWDTASGRCLHTFPDYQGIDFKNMAFSPDGRLFATAVGKYTSGKYDKWKGAIQLWDTAAEKLVSPNPANLASEVIGLDFGLRDRLLIIRGMYGGIAFWDLQKGNFQGIPGDQEEYLRKELFGDRSPEPPKFFSTVFLGMMKAFALSPDGRSMALGTFFTGGMPGERITRRSLILVNLETLVELQALDLKSQVEQLSFSPDGKRLAAVTETGVKIYGLPKLPVLKDCPWKNGKRDEQYFAGQWSPGNLLLIVGDEESTVLDTTTGKSLYSFLSRVWGEGYDSFSPDGRLLAVSQPGRVELREARSGEVVWTLPNREVGGVAFSPDGRLLATADTAVEIWQMPKALWLKKAK
jgi:WD40 repeat protein